MSSAPQRLLPVAGAVVGACLLLGSSMQVNDVSRRVFSRSSMRFSNFTLDLTPAQFYGKMMSRSTLRDFFPFAGSAIDAPAAFGSGAISLPIWPAGQYILYDLSWEYSGIVFSSTPTVFKYRACFIHHGNVTKAETNKCLVTLADKVTLAPADEGKRTVVQRQVTNVQPNIPLAGLIIPLLGLHTELHHHVVVKREWQMAADSAEAKKAS